MEFIKPGTKINFMGYMFHALAFSGLLIVASLVGIFGWPGPNWGIDFAGGTEMQVAFKQPVDMGKLRAAVESLNLGDVKVQEWLEPGEQRTNKYLIRMEKLKKEKSASVAKAGEAESAKEEKKSADLVEDKLAEVFGKDSFEVLKTDYVGPRVGGELRRNGIMAVFIVLALLLVYISLRFEFRFAVGAVLALAHDVTITTGAFVWTHKEFSLAIIAALLTILGYSLNDTIVVFDRIRENTRKKRRLDFTDMINVSINETLSRTILTSLTTLVVVLFLWLFGGSVIHDFSFALLIGVIVGTYSSIFVASAFVVLWERTREKKRTPAAEARPAK